MNNPYRPPEATPSPEQLRRASSWKPSPEASRNTARAHRALALFYGAVALVVGVLAWRAHHELEDGLIAAAVVGLPALLHAVIQFGAQRRSGWARGASKAVGIMMLFAIPIGTLIGIYLLRNASKVWVPPQAR